LNRDLISPRLFGSSLEGGGKGADKGVVGAGNPKGGPGAAPGYHAQPAALTAAA